MESSFRRIWRPRNRRNDLRPPVCKEKQIPYLGLCLGMQLTIVEFARNVLGYADAHSKEFNEETTHPMIHIMPDQDGVTDLGGTLRLGSYPCVLAEDLRQQSFMGKKKSMRDIVTDMRSITSIEMFSRRTE